MQVHMKIPWSVYELTYSGSEEQGCRYTKQTVQHPITLIIIRYGKQMQVNPVVVWRSVKRHLLEPKGRLSYTDGDVLDLKI